MPQTRSRIVGSGNTVLLVNGQRIAFMTSVADTPPTAVGQSQVIQGIDDKYPVEIVTANAVGVGSLTLSLVELWDENVWERILGFAGAATLRDVYERNLQNDDITGQKIIKMPNGDRRGKVYHGCKIISVSEGETITNEAMTTKPTITMNYLKVTAF